MTKCRGYWGIADMWMCACGALDPSACAQEDAALEDDDPRPLRQPRRPDQQMALDLD